MVKVETLRDNRVRGVIGKEMVNVILGELL